LKSSEGQSSHPEFANKIIKVEQLGRTWSTKLQIWDLCSDRASLSKTNHWRGAALFICVYDVTKEKSLKNLDSLLEESDYYGCSNAVKVLVGNKCDLRHLREIPTETAKDYSLGKFDMFMETSALDGTNIDLLFECIACELLKDEIKAEQVKKQEIQTYKDAIELFCNSQQRVTKTALTFKQIQRDISACDTLASICEKIGTMKQVASPADLQELNKIFDEDNRLKIEEELVVTPAVPIKNAGCIIF
jgi:GTPase SAR1 family protein